MYFFVILCDFVIFFFAACYEMILTKMVYSSEQIDTNAYNYLKKSVVFKNAKKEI